VILIILGINGAIIAQFTSVSEEGISDEEILSLHIPPQSNGLLAGTNGGGVFWSSNSWEAINEGLTSNKVNSLAAKSEEVFFAGTDDGVFLFVDGVYWIAVNNGLTNLNVNAITINGDNIFAGTQGGGVFLSTDNGSNWAAVNNDLTNLNVSVITINGDEIFAGTDGGVFLSTDNGSNWAAVNNGLTSLNVRAIEIYGGNIFAGTDGGVFLTTDNAQNWIEVNNGLPNTNITSLAIYGSYEPYIFVGTSGGGVFLSDNNGSSWKDISSGLPINDVRALAVNQNEYDYIYAGTWGSGVWKRLLTDFSTLEVSTDSIRIGGLDYSTATFDITSNSNYYITSSAPWLTANPTGGYLNKTITLTATENTTNDERNATITIKGLNITPDVPLIVEVIQNKIADNKQLGVSETSLSIDAEVNSTATFTISSNTDWLISSSDLWLTTYTPSGSGDALVVLTAEKNTSTEPRPATIIVSGTGVSNQTIIVAQEGAEPEINLSTNSLIITAEENSTETFDITSNTNWSVSSSETWLTVSPNSGSDTATITLSATENLSISPRTAIITVSGTEILDKSITVTQDGANPVLSVSGNSLTIEAIENSTVTVEITSNTNWNVSSSKSWLTVSQNSGFDNADITLTSEENPSTEIRTAIVTITGTDVANQTITVTQEGAEPELTVSSNTLTIASPEGSTASIDVVSNITWIVSSSESWLTTGIITIGDNNSIGLTAEANLSATPRTALVTVSGTGVSDQEITVTQEGTTPAIILSPNSIIIAAPENSTATFNVLSNTSWTVSSSETWLTSSPNSGSDTAIVTITAEANTAISQRAVVVTVTATGVVDQTIMVIQNGTPSTTKNINSNSFNIYPNPVSEMLHIEGLQKETIGSIYNANGQMVQRSRIGIEEGEIYVSKLPAGLYILKMSVDNEVMLKMFIKE